MHPSGCDCFICDPGNTKIHVEILGLKGGKAGKGEAKRRGDSEYYRSLRAKRKAKVKQD